MVKKSQKLVNVVGEQLPKDKSGFVKTCDVNVLRHAEWGHVREKCW